MMDHYLAVLLLVAASFSGAAGCAVATDCGKPRDCKDIQTLGQTSSGLYTIYYLDGATWIPVRVYCDMETAGGGWLVFQRRQDGSEAFYRNWADYTDGFGDLSGEFWLGNEILHMVISCGQYKLRIDLEDFEEETRYAEYSYFTLASQAADFAFTVSGYSGDAGDCLSHVSGARFSTKDHDRDTLAGSCAVKFKGAWWYTNCHQSNLNGLYLSGPHSSYADGMEWYKWHGHHYSLKFSEMKIKPQ